MESQDRMRGSHLHTHTHTLITHPADHTVRGTAASFFSSKWKTHGQSTSIQHGSALYTQWSIKCMFHFFNQCYAKKLFLIRPTIFLQFPQWFVELVEFCRINLNKIKCVHGSVLEPNIQICICFFIIVDYQNYKYQVRTKIQVLNFSLKFQKKLYL